MLSLSLSLSVSFSVSFSVCPLTCSFYLAAHRFMWLAFFPRKEAQTKKTDEKREVIMSDKKDYNSLKADRKTIAAIASATVDGYLRNASRRHRVPAAEGGRGTRRKLAMVTSATVAEESNPNAAVDADEDWDEVDLPTVPVKKQEHMKMDYSTAPTADEATPSDVKGERNASGLPVVKDEPSPGLLRTSLSATTAKTETVIVDDDAVAAVVGQPFDPDSTALPQGARPPLIEQPRRTAWRQRSDPAYEAMRERMDLLAAQRRSDRLQRTCVAITTLLSLLVRGRLLWREAHHPKLLRALLAVERANSGDTASTVEPEAKRRKSESSKGKCQENPKRRCFVLSHAVTRAKALGKEAANPQLSKPSLAPVWVTATRDTVKNRTSEAVLVLVKAINDVFELHVPEPETACDDGNQSSRNNNTEEGEDGAAHASVMADWSAPIEPQFLTQTLRNRRVLSDTDASDRIALPHTLYFSVIFLALAAIAKLDCRLVIAKQMDRGSSCSSDGIDRGGNGSRGTSSLSAVGNEEAPTVTPKLAKMSIFPKEPKKRGRQVTTAADENGATEHAEGEQVKSKKLPTSCFWVEVWSVERNSFVAVNPCAGCATIWGAPYTFSIGGDVIVDATPRYTSKFSSAFSFNRRLGRVSAFGFLWKDKLKWDDNREISEVLLESFSKDRTTKTRERLPREQKQLESLAYSEPVPTTLTALHRHPLFVIESDLARHEGVYPKDASTTVGRVKGHMVYKRSAVVNLRSRDGWLREGRSLCGEDEPPYKQVPPPASRPFAAPSMFFGMWQTKPFEPLPLREDGSIPHHGRTSWYILLDAQPPKGIVHLTEPLIARVARRMQLDFGLAVVGFNKRRIDEHRRGHWEAVIDGIAVREVDQPRLLYAYKEWMQLVQEQEAAKRRDRALHWWQLFIQRMLAMDRLRSQYLDGAARGSLPSM